MTDLATSTVRWGILGCAYVARHRWIPAIKSASAGRVVALASRTLDKARSWAEQLDIPKFYGSYQDLLDDPEIDAVYIGLPNSMHHTWAINSLCAHKHVLCDKPLSLNAAEAQEIVDTAERQNRLLVEGFMYQYHSQYELIRRWLNQARIGTPKMLRIGFSAYFDYPGNIRYDRCLGGGVLLDLGCYCVHLARLLIQDEPRRVRAFSIMNDTGVDWTTLGVMEFDRQVTTLFDCSFAYDGQQFFHFAGTGGLICSNRPFNANIDGTLSLKTPSESITESLVSSPQYTQCVNQFHHRLASKEFRPSPGRDSIANMRVLDALARSAAQNRPVDL